MEQAQKSRIGRPLSFDRTNALEQAMMLFWRHGYEGTSVSDLTAAMGVTPPSIYAAFGDKRGLFTEALHRYLNGPVTSAQIIRDASTARDAAQQLLSTSAIGFSGLDTPPGCMLATATISCSAASADVQAEMAAIRRGIEAQLKAKIEDDMAENRLPATTDPHAAAGHIMAVIQGLSTLARDGASREKLMRIVGVTMAGWPSP